MQTRPPATCLPFRQVHLDFHTSEFIEDVGRDFRKTDFIAALRRGHANSVTAFAKCHHGWSYYPTKVGHPHPHLKRNLLGEMVSACRESGIAVPIYLTVQWDERTARAHPEWRVIKADNAPFQSSTPDDRSAMNQLGAQWHPLCLNHKPFVDHLIAQANEVADLFAPDGLFMDILLPWECVCRECLQSIDAAGLDPEKPADRLENHRRVIFEYYRTFHERVIARRPGMRVFHNSGHIHKNERERWKYFTHLELESLPTGGWGYDHFPVSARYANTLGHAYLGMTGKFHSTWGEFGGFKRPTALAYECLQMVSLGARCSVGDQLHPLGIMDPATYDLIGAAYARVEKLEPWLTGARPRSEIAIFSAEGHWHNRAWERSDTGCARILLESQIPFDVIDAGADFPAYRLIILPDAIEPDAQLARRLRAFVKNGGSLLLSGSSGMNPTHTRFLLPIRATVDGQSDFRPDYLVATPSLDPDLVASPIVVYDRAYRIKAKPGARVLAETRLPYFNRTWRHFCSHQHAPPRPERNSSYDGIVHDGRILAFAHPIFGCYFDRGQPHYKYLVRGAIRRLLPESGREVNVRMPSAGRISLMEQPSENRLLLHLLYCQPQLRGESGFGWEGRQKMEIIEDAVPVFDIPCRIRLPRKPRDVRLASTGRAVPFTHRNGAIEFVVRKVDLHELVVIER